MTLPVSGPITFSEVNVELGLSATAQISLNDAVVRALFGVPSGAISMSNGYGKANQFAFTISSNQTNANLRTLAVNAGWDQTTKVVATIASGVYCSSNSTGTPGLTINGSFPGGVELVNQGFIIGMGGAGGRGGGIQTSSKEYIVTQGTAGSSGGLALSVSVPVSINNSGTIGGGGGGGGGGRAGDSSGNDQFVSVGGGGGGGGRSSAAANSSAGSGGVGGSASGNSGSVGTSSAAGAGGPPRGTTWYAGYVQAGAGGDGGGWGSSGSTGSSSLIGLSVAAGPYGGGGGGGAISGNGNITWIATGTRLGSIS